MCAWARLKRPRRRALEWTVASAIPKGPRVDWMIEKLAELGADHFIPLAAERSVVLPEGAGKRQRWERLSAEAAKQCRRAGVMRIGPLTPLAEAMAGAVRGEGSVGWYLSTALGAVAVAEAMAGLVEWRPRRLTLFIGPEGGWSDAEIQAFDKAGLTGVALGATILRIETAALCAASLVAAVLVPQLMSIASTGETKTVVDAEKGETIS